MASDLIASRAVVAVQNQPLARPRATADFEAAKRAADAFEAVFLSQMLQSMSAGLKTDGPFGGGFSESIYRSMINEQYAEVMSGRSGIGVSDAVLREILKIQEASQ